jgi:integral membrane protein
LPKEILNLRILSFIEGLSLLAILFVTMPMKYFYQFPTPNKFSGMIHGVLFILYIAFLFQVKESRNWNLKKFFYLVFLSSIPFGFIIFEFKKEWQDS